MDRQRVVRVRRGASGGGGSRYRFGSGYLVAPGWVLTAAHVLIAADFAADVPGDITRALIQGAVQEGDPCEVAVWASLEAAGDPDEVRWSLGTVAALDSDLDVAAVRVGGIGTGIGDLALGRLEGDEPVQWTAVGFPLAGRDARGRQPEQVWGTASSVTGAFMTASSGRHLD
ncbi:trypsin-like peptidase domain-containing protein [Streptacidiphilus sp. PAMC 29251]